MMLVVACGNRLGRPRLLAAMIVTLLASPSLGRAERRSVEVLGGVAVPVANEDYKKRFADGPTFGVRVALAVNDLVAIDASVDFNSLDERAHTFVPPFDVMDAQRLRFLGGARIIKRRGSQHAFLRVAAGIEVVHMTGEFNFVQMPDYEETDSTVGAVFQLGGGLMIDIRKVSVGGQVALSQAWHPGASSKWEDLAGSVEDDGLELEVTFVGALRF